jgi:hypothetical protein
MFFTFSFVLSALALLSTSVSAMPKYVPQLCVALQVFNAPQAKRRALQALYL